MENNPKKLMYSEHTRKIVLKKLKQGVPKEKLAREFEITARTIYNWEKTEKIEGRTYPILHKNRKKSNIKIIPVINDSIIFEKAVKSSNGTRQSIADWYFKLTNIKVTIDHVRGALKRYKYTRKKFTPRFKESNENECKEFIEKVKKLDSRYIIFVDESHIKEMLLSPRGYAKKGEKYIKNISGKNNHSKINIIAGLRRKKIIAPFTFQGSCDKNIFEHWFEHSLLKKLTGKHYIILDNAPIHKKERLKEIATKYNCEVFFCPPTPLT